MRKLRRILIVLLLVAVVAIFGASFYLAGLTAEPRGNTLDEEEGVGARPRPLGGLRSAPARELYGSECRG